MFDATQRRVLEAMGYQMLVRPATAALPDRASSEPRKLASDMPAAVIPAAVEPAADMHPGQSVDEILPVDVSEPIGDHVSRREQIEPANRDRAHRTSTQPPVIADPRPPSSPITAADNQPGDRVWQAVLAAAQLTPQGASDHGCRRAQSGIPVEYVRDELWIDPQALASDPRAKRSLWKTLRTLRRNEARRQR